MRRLKFVLIVALLVVAAAIAVAKAERVNKSAAQAGLYYSTAKEEEDPVGKAGSVQSSSIWKGQDDRDADGGFSSLDGMLQWAIGHSDPTKLKETAEDVKRLSPDELKKRHMEIKELMENLKTPSDAQLMQTAIDDLNNSSLPLEDHLLALQELLILVEPIDNAIDLQKLGGLAVIIRELNHPDLEIRTTSAWILGKACQNNPVVQKQLLELGALEKLMEIVKSDFFEEAIKALYAVSALIRNNFDGQELFLAEGGELILQVMKDILSNSSINIRLRRKAVFLLADLVECQIENENKPELPFFSNRFFLKSVVDLLASADLDLQEKALYAIKNLLQSRSTEALVFKEFCELDVALEKLRQQLQQLMIDENYREYALDLESLRGEIVQIFLGKLDKLQEL